MLQLHAGLVCLLSKKMQGLMILWGFNGVNDAA